MDNIAGTLALIRNFFGAMGIFLGFFFFFSGEIRDAITVVSIISVGLVGIIAFISHVIYAKSDAARLGWESNHPYWQYEVGFANLSMAGVTIAAWAGSWGVRVSAALILCFAAYLLQAGILHGSQVLIKKDGKHRGKALVTICFSMVMVWFGLMGILSG